MYLSFFTSVLCSLVLLPAALFAQPDQLYVSPDFDPTATIKVLSTPGDQVGVARLEYALLQRGFAVVSDARLRTHLTTATTTLQLADTTFRRPYREPVAVPVLPERPSTYVATAQGRYTVYRGETLTTRTDVRVIKVGSGRLVASFHFDQRCTLSSEPLHRTFDRFARALRVGVVPVEQR